MVNKIETKKRGKLFAKQQSIDEHGELHDILLIGSPEEFDRNFIKVFHAFTEALLKNEKIAGKAIRLLFWIMTQLENGSIEFYMHYSVIKEELGVSKDTYYRWVKTLTEEGIIKKVRPNIYQVNPACVVKGKGHTLLEEFKQPRLFE
jgi:hypothetical protein